MNMFIYISPLFKVKLVAMAPGTTTWPTVAPSNTHLRLHLGLVIPSNANIRVANETRSVMLFIANIITIIRVHNILLVCSHS